jgi:hypothetical protein
MKKSLLSIIILFATLFSFNELGSNIMQIDSNDLKSNTVFEQHIEDDTAELDISLNLEDISVLPLIVTRSAQPLIKNAITIWKPPVNA